MTRTDAVPPTFRGVFDQDMTTLAEHVSALEGLLAALPAKPDRDPDEQVLAERLLADVRASRGAFLARHVDAVYDQLTDGRTRHVRLAELVGEVGERFPSLVPTADQMRAEGEKVQADKDGREIDQGIVCGAVLRSPTAGRHLIDAMLMPTRRATELLDDFRSSGRIELGSVLVERRGNAAHVTFNNAHCLNAEDNGLIADLETAVDIALLDDQVSVGVLRGGYVDHPKYLGRRVFSAGINLKDLHDGAISFTEFLMGRELGYINKIVRGLLVDPDREAWSERTIAKPWVGAVDTFAIGGGMQLLLVLDRVVAEQDAYFSLPAAEEGIVPGLGNLRLTRAAGARLARQVILGGHRIKATDPEARLVCDEVVPADGMDDAINRAVRDLGNSAVAANRLMLAIAEEPIDLFRSYLAEFAVAQPMRTYSDDVLAKVRRRWSSRRTDADER